MELRTQSYCTAVYIQRVSSELRRYKAKCMSVPKAGTAVSKVDASNFFPPNNGKRCREASTWTALAIRHYQKAKELVVLQM